MFDTTTLREKFERATPYGPFLEALASAGMDGAWRERYGQLELDPEQAALCRTFVRSMPVLCLTGPWCGDCALQGAAMQRISEGSGGIVDLRFLNRDEHPDLQVKVRINQGTRVPVTFFMAEDFEAVSTFGDRTLSRYRSMARKALGDAAVLAAPPENPVREVLSEVLDEMERVQLLLRVSRRLRDRHGD